ncbi:SDR family oxidoreductase [Cellvibrio fibrivorans]|uniref:Nucleoside-diphosphate-sugar epimerase n=1 Tax=Cellvibrio fibrivorans TaxID=126350 RepID=A0ABU1UU91_9GAMM|nr:SDR family oxidoreductase [Cellvibrio fibrivorans]MDR7088751.1 nucleoside-diphosphate-sugar epimerase [Cellvibrio fibrivorans]
MTINASSQEKLLIIGCGDIGQRLALQLASHHYRITGLRRHPPEDLPYLQYRVCDATQTGQLDALLGSEAFDVIVISMTPAERSDAGYEQAYVQTCRNLVAGLKRHQQQPRLVLFVSSTAVYGQNDGSWVDESSPTQPESFSGNRLLEAEQVIQANGFAHSCIRFSGIYGPGRNRLIEQVKQQRASASPHYTNRIHADDCAGVLAHLIELQHKQDLAPVYLATDSSPTPMVEVVNWIAEQLGIRDFLASDAVNERGNKRISNQRLLATGYSFRYPDFRAGYASLINLQA